MDPNDSIALGLFVPIHDPSSKNESTPFPLNGVDLETVSDEQLVAIGNTAPIIYSLMSTKIVRLSLNLVLKFGAAIHMQEIEAMKYVLSRTQVPTPKVHRNFFIKIDSPFGQCGYIVMDYVEGGNTLTNVWEMIDQDQRRGIIEQVANIISDLQSVHFEQPGPIGGGQCRGFWFSDYGAGPFADRGAFNAWLNHKLDISKKVGRAEKTLPRFEYKSFVLVHHDISPDNLMVDPTGKVWIIDWGNSGAYPAIFEAARMCEGSGFPEFDALLLPRIYNNAAERKQLLGIRWSITIAACQ